MRTLRFDSVGDDKLRVGSEHAAESQAEIHRHTDDKRDVGLLQRAGSGAGEGQLMIGGHYPPRHAVHQHGDSAPLGQPQHRGLGASPPHVGARHDHRPLSLGQQTRRQLQCDAVHRWTRTQVIEGTWQSGIGGLGERVVHRDVDERHAGWRGDRRPQRIVDQGSGGLRRRCGRREPRERGHKRHMVDLLQRPLAPPQRRSPSAEHHQRRLVLLGCGHRAHAVGDARPGRERCHARAARHLRPALGRERGRLLVPGVHQPDAFAAATVVEREQMTAGQGEHGVDAAGFQATRDQPSCVYGSFAAHGGEPKRREPAEFGLLG